MGRTLGTVLAVTRGSDPASSLTTMSSAGAPSTSASAFVAQCYVGAKAETTDGVFQVRDDEREPRVGGCTGL